VVEKQRKKRAEIYELNKLNFESFDDDVERSKQNLEFYRDSSKWWSKRLAIRSKELDQDERERHEEANKIELERMEKQKQRDAADAKRAEAERIEREREAASFLSSLEQPDVTVSRIMTAKERAEAIKQLVASIPVDQESLFGFPIQWKFIDKAIGD
jgi:alpha-galactosidase/6-phospho-beta-glucosidase family protein